VLAYLGRLLGDRVAAALRQAPYGTVSPVMPRPHPTVIAALSRLAGLESARRTTPVPCSPLWTMEAADLARQGRRPAALGHTGPPLPSVPAAPPRLPAAAAGKSLSGWLDPALVLPGVFRYGLSPDSDLDIRVHDEGHLITVETRLARGVGRSALASCRVRLVDSDARRILAVSPLRPHGMHARAELLGPAAADTPSLPTHAGAATASLPVHARAAALWVEVVDHASRPVRGTGLRRMRRALRWADAALRAASRPAGLDPGRTDEQWAQLAALAWDRCRADWSAAGDAERAEVAARLARYPVRWTRPYLAEATCDPATAR